MSVVHRLFNTLINPRTSVPPVEAGLQPGGYRYGHPLANGPLLMGLLIVGLLLVMMLLGPLWTAYDPYLAGVSVLPHFDMEAMEFIRPPFKPSAEHWLGTDRWGNDILGQIVHGARLTLIGAGVITFSRLLLGTLLGSIGGWLAGRWPDRIVMGLITTLTALPSLISAYILVTVLGPEKGLPAFLIALTVLGWTEVAQYVRSELLVIREQPYIEGAESIGMTDLQLVVRHVWPNLLPHLVVLAFLEMGTVLILLAELGFLGVFMGDISLIQFDAFNGPIYTVTETPEWGLLVAQGENSLRPDPHVVLGPALAFFVAVLGFNALGEGLRSLLDRAGLSTAFLLKRWMLVAVPLVLAGTALLLQYTGPRLSYARLADTFEPANVAGYGRRLEATSGPEEAAALLAATMEEMDLQEGLPVPGSKVYVQTRESRLLSLSRPPQLELLGADWTPQVRLEPGRDFNFSFGNGAGPGDVVGPLTFVHFAPDNADAVQLRLQDVELEGRILMLSNPPEDLPLVPLYQGARGVLIVSEQLPSPPALIESRYQGPVFYITPAAAAAVLAEEGLDMGRLIASGEQGSARVIAETEIMLHMSLYLDEPDIVPFPVVAGYLPGYDLEHADELLLVLSTFDGTDPDHVEAGTVPLMLELARSWKAKDVAPRRSVLFLAWGGPPEAAAEMLRPGSFQALAPLVPAASTHTEAIIHLGAGDGDGLWISPEGSQSLLYQMEDAVGWNTQVAGPPAASGDLRLREPAYLYLQGDPAAAGRATSLTLIRLARVTELELPRQDSAAIASNR